MMFNSIYRVLVGSCRASYPTRNVRFIPFSSKSPKPIFAPNKDSFTVKYLMNTFEFSEEKAIVASKHLKINSPEKPETFVAFLKNRGLTADQIGSIVRINPQILQFNPQKTFMPKIDFFLSSGISQTEVNNIILAAPSILARSLENTIMPSFNYIKSLFDSNGTGLSSMKRLAPVFGCNLESELIPNLEILRDVGVPNSRIVMLLQNFPRALMIEKEKFRKVVKEVKQMDINPCKGTFILAIYVIRSMGKLTWEKKVATYKKWGLSENDISLAFWKQPRFMTLSTNKITAVMDFFVNEMELHYSFVVNRPNIITYSLEKRLRPRYSIYKILVANGLIKKGYFLNTIFIIRERDFLLKFVQLYEKDVPGLLQFYQKNLAVLKS